jgi:UDP-N-acetylmuramoyl-L-alanyl-D-glutamate--2,6-diaminopimelate ligase
MPLSALLAAVPATAVVGSGDPEVAGIAYDSRLAQPGDLFVALPGMQVDGHRFIEAAVSRGAAAVLCQRAPSKGVGVPHLVVPDSRAAMADVAAAFYGRPAARLRMVGITGTDGKTTTGFLIHALLRGTGHPAGLLGTVAFRIDDREQKNEARLSTPESPDVQRLLAEMVAAGAEYAVVEATSHGLVLDRLRGCRFDVGVFTNLAHDHLDFHGTMENYRDAKARLFQGLSQEGVAILNRDDACYEFMRSVSGGVVLSYGLHSAAEVRACDVAVTVDGIRFVAETPAGAVEVASPLTGRFNVHNLLAALAFACSQGIDVQQAAAALATLSHVPGRMTRVDAGQPFTVMIDYAHAPNSLTKVLDELRPLTHGRLIAVFGAGGDRDQLKRPIMGRIAAERCDAIVLTDEDPYSERSEDIIAAIAAGARAAGAREGETLWLCPDRHEAILLAIGMARPGDTVLFAGKGHEASIVTGGQRRPWDEEAEVRAAIAATMGVRA